MKKLVSPLVFALLAAAVPALASVTVSSPANYSTVGTPFTLSASASPCSTQAISAMGYSLDNSTSTVTVNGSTLLASVSATAGSHTLHVKSWGTSGASCVTNVAITVSTTASTTAAPTAATTSTSTTTNVAVSAPLNGASLASPFAVAATGTLCSGQPITAMGYSLDNSTSTTIVNGTSLAGQLSAAAGAHTVHVKSWGNSGASCVSNISVNVTAPVQPAPAPPTTSAPVIPSNAIAVNSIQQMNTWTAAFDTGTSGISSGTMNLMTAPALSNASRQFATSYSNYGGERYNVTIGTDAASQNFVYDTYIYLETPINDIANIEMDLNQTMSNGQTVIFGFQCDGWSRTWDYTQNTGTPTSPNDQWMHSNQTCNPQAWTANTWHHVQVSYSRDSSGNVTYQSVWFDGVEQDLNVTVPSAFALGWGPALLTNFQIDGMTATAGSATVYLDKMTIYRW